MLGKPKPVPPDHPDYCDWIDNLTWRLSGRLQKYTRAREILKYLRQNGHLSGIATDHELAYDYALDSCEDDSVRKYFETIISDER